MELKSLTKKELEKKAIALEKEIRENKFEIKSGKGTDLNEYRKMKKDLSRVLTMLKEIELGIRKEPVAAKKVVAKKDAAKKEEKKPAKTKKVVKSKK